MLLLRKFRFSLALIMMMVVTAAAASALFAKVRAHTPAAGQAYLKVDAPILFILSIGLTAIGLGSLKGHSAGQMMLQITVACLGYVSLIGIAEAGWERPLLYWFQVSFGIFVTGPLLARQFVKSEMERGPRRDWWKKTCESFFFAFLTMLLVLVGLILEWLAVLVGSQVAKGAF
ncbi:hypothetical protein P12x_002665 [Tundrisphaera lichenicola]|uniref:hypothetical protein n=1 Tax=Tundrisphaera lichenicola TaxID=2029860 RepID=UPI003EB72FAF